MAKVLRHQQSYFTGLSYKPPEKGWMDVKPDFRPGTYCNRRQPQVDGMDQLPLPGSPVDTRR